MISLNNLSASAVRTHGSKIIIHNISIDNDDNTIVNIAILTKIVATGSEIAKDITHIFIHFWKYIK